MKKPNFLFPAIFALSGLLQGQTSPCSRPVDIVFVVDVTSSMREELGLVYNHFSRLTGQFSDKSLRTAGLVFRDYGERFVFQSSPFSEETQTTLHFVRSFQAVGGGDDPEPLNETLSKLAQFSWRQEAAKLVFLLSDAPPRDPGHTEAILMELIQRGIRVIAFPPLSASPEAAAWQEMVSALTDGLLLKRDDPSWPETIRDLACSPGPDTSAHLPSPSISVFPSPARINATIASTGDPLEEVLIFDSLGKLIYFQSGIASTTMALELGSFTPGIYWVKTGAGNGKLIVME